jgi:carbonic anhydrase/acetyltransferase-like protein (isoleucine patch superfamily)
VMGPAVIGKRGGRPSFVGFNAYVDRATVEEDAMVGVLARVAPGVVIRSGRKVLPGKLVRTQAEADSLALGKVDVVTDADRQFMEGVLHVNVAFARQYIELYRTVPTEVRGIARDPGNSDFNHGAELPVLGGRASAHPDFAARIIGWVTMDNTVDELTGLLGSQVSIRADEGERFRFGRLAAVRDKVTFHALEHTRLSVGNGVRIGAHVVVHGGDDAGNAPRDETVVGDSVGVGDWAVVFRSTIGNGSVIGERAIIDGSQLPPGTIVPDRAIIIKNKRVGTVEW